eukprot:gene22251-28822_t
MDSMNNNSSSASSVMTNTFMSWDQYKYIDCVSHSLELGMQSFLTKTENCCDNGELQRPKRPLGWTTMKAIKSLVSAVKYGLSVMLMLVAMTFNPSLFLALFVGYWVGDMMFCDYRLDLSMRIVKPTYSNGGLVGSLIRWALCVPLSHQEFIRSSLYNKESTMTVDKASYHNNWTLWLLPRLSSLIYLVILLVWIIQVEGGFGYVEDSVFGWHALLMSFFVVLFTNEALLTYRAPLLPQLTNNIQLLKYYHVICHVFSMVQFPFYTMYSPHSWLGVLTVALFGIQVIFSVSINYVKAVKSLDGRLATCITGFQDMQSSDLASSTPATTTMIGGTMTEMPAMGYSYNSTSSQLASAG